MTKHDHWKTTDVDGEDAVYRQERIDAEFCRKFGTVDAPGEAYVIALSLFNLAGVAGIYALLVAEFEKLTPDQQESFLGMDND